MSEDLEVGETIKRKFLNLFIFGTPIILGIVWIMGVPLQLGLQVLDGNYLAILLAFALSASYLYWPYK